MNIKMNLKNLKKDKKYLIQVKKISLIIKYNIYMSIEFFFISTILKNYLYKSIIYLYKYFIMIIIIVFELNKLKFSYFFHF